METNTQPQETTNVAPAQNVQSKAVAWLGVTGSTLLMVSATIFVWSGWNNFPDATKCGIIALITALCFGTGKFLSKTLPIMGSIFTHLAIFLTPIVLLSANMMDILPWRNFLVLEGFFCVAWFAGIAQVYKSRILIPASLLSTTLIALGLSSLEGTVFGKVPASLYMIPVVIGLAASKKFSRSSLFVLVAVGFSPIVTLIQPTMHTGRVVVGNFGFTSTVHWGYSLAVAAGLLIATIVASRVQKSIAVLTLIPITVLPYLIVSLTSAHLTSADLYIIAPLLLLLVQAFLFLAKSDEFFSHYVEGFTKAFNVFVLIIEGYVAAAVTTAYTIFLVNNYSNNDAFLGRQQSIGLLLIVCVAFVSYLDERNAIQEAMISFFGFFSVGILAELTNVIDHSHRETRMILAAIVVGLASMAFRKNMLSSIIVPLTGVAIYVSTSQYSLTSELIVMAVTYVALMLYGMYQLKKTNEPLQWIAASALAMWLIAFGTVALSQILPDALENKGLYEIAFIFLVGLGLTEVVELLTIGKSYIFTSDSEVGYLRAARILMVTAYASTWFLGDCSNKLYASIFAGIVVAFGVVGAWRRRESLTMILTAPTFIVGLYAMANYFSIENKTLSLILIGSAGVWVFISTYMKYATLGCYVHGAVAATYGVALSLNSSDSTGQALFLVGLIIIAIGVIRSVHPLIPIGAVVSTLGLWIALAAQEVNELTLYVAPVCVGLIALGMYNRNVFPTHNNTTKKRTSSWEAYGFALVLFLSASFIDSINTGSHIHSLIGGGVAVAAIAIGAWRKLIAPLVVGTAFLILFLVREIFNVASAVPLFAWIGLGAFILIAVAVTLEKSQLTPTQARKRVSAVVADHFE